MADFRIDRIRFRWRGDWSANTLYVKDDVLRYGAKVFVCVEVHTSDTNFYNDLNNTTPRWVQMMDGQSWTGDWAPSTFYKIGELIHKRTNPQTEGGKPITPRYDSRST